MNAAPEDQAALWNGIAGRMWVESQALLDQAFHPLEALLLEEVRVAGARQVLDIGCGTGATTLAIARQLGGQGRCVGVDISRPMIEAARERASGTHAGFVCADAQSQRFDAGAFDLVVSRFGVMFFDDPVRAFANLRSALRPGGALRALAWRGAAENPFMTTAERAAAPLLTLPPRAPGGPGQFAFADPDQVRRILQDSGWSDIELRPVEVSCRFPARQLPDYLERLGPLGRVLQQMEEAERHRIVAAVRPAFEPFLQGQYVCFTATCWMLCAEAP